MPGAGAREGCERQLQKAAVPLRAFIYRGAGDFHGLFLTAKGLPRVGVWSDVGGSSTFLGFPNLRALLCVDLL